MTISDKTGMTFGRLTVLNRDHGIHWRVMCVCGNEKVVEGGSLVKGDTQSCGCIRKDVGLKRRLDRVGQVFGRLTVVSRIDRVHVVAKCDCGNVITAQTGNLISGTTKSCGCLARELSSIRTTTHGMSKSKSYKRWTGLIQRVLNPDNKAAKHYSLKGVTVCDRWLSFENFYADMGEAPPGCSLDRIDNDGPYSPENCRWATPKEQADNRSSSVWIEFQGERMVLFDWARRLGVRYSTMQRRLKDWPLERALTEPSNRKTA